MENKMFLTRVAFVSLLLCMPLLKVDAQSNGQVKQQKELDFQQDNSKIFDVVEEMPSYPGGMGAMMSFISSNVKFPDGDYCAQGRVIVSFVVEKDGSLSNVKILRSVEKLLDQEAIRIVKSMPKWKPARQNGKVVRCKYTVPVAFHLQ